MNFEREKESKERQIEHLTKDLNDVKLQIRAEKRKLDDVEEQEDQLDEERIKLLEELDKLDDEFEMFEKTKSQSSEGHDGFHDEDEYLLIQKLEQESQYLSKLLFSSDEDVTKAQSEVSKTQTSIQKLEMENKNLEKKLSTVVDLDEELEMLSKELSDNLDTEKRIFNENLILLKELKVMEEADQELQHNFQKKEEFIRRIHEQMFLERQNRQFQYQLYELKEKIDYKVIQFNQIKWKFEKATSIISDSEIKKVVGLEGFKQKIEKFNMDLNQLIAEVENITAEKQTLDNTIHNKEDQQLNSQDIANKVKQLEVLMVELQLLVTKEKDHLDINRLNKAYQDILRDTEFDFLRKAKNLNQATQNKILTLIQENVFNEIPKQEKEEVKHQIKKILYDIDDYEIQKELNIDLLVTFLIKDSTQTQLVNKDIKFFYQLEFIEQFKKLQQKQEIKHSIQNKIKKINDNINELDKLLQNNSNNMDNLEKDASYLKESEFSPVKGKISIIYGVKGDIEKENDIQIQNKQIEQVASQLEAHKQERDKLKKLLKQYQQKFNDLDLENANIIKLEELIDEVNSDLDYKTEALKRQVKNQLDNDLKQLQDQVQARIDKFQAKRQVLSDCRQEEKEKRLDILKCDHVYSKISNRLEKLEKELKFQSSGQNLNSDKENLLNKAQKDLQQLKQQLQHCNKELDDQKHILHSASQELNLIGDKIVSLEQLKSIYSQLKEMNKLKKIQDQMRALGEEINMKQIAIEQFLGDLLGVSLFDCERKFKEAEMLVDNITKMIMKLNNGLNDFDIDLKKGLHLYQNDDDVQKEGKKIQDENQKDRKDLKNHEEQRNMIRKVLHKIKNSLNDQEQQKLRKSTNNKLTANNIEEFINEIETCMDKCHEQLKELGQTEQGIEKRKEAWEKLMFKGGAKEALIDDIDKALKDNESNYEKLAKKLQEAEENIEGLDAITKAMANNPDFELRTASIKKMQDALKNFKDRKADIQKELSKINDNINKLRQSKQKGLRGLTLEQLQDLAKVGEDTGDQLQKETKKTNALLLDIQKKRSKLGDADLNDILRKRQAQIVKVEDMAKANEEDFGELEKILQEASKINPESIKDSVKKINDMKKEMVQIMEDKDDLKQKLQQIKDKLKLKDLSRDDPKSFIPILKELYDIGNQLDKKEAALAQIQKTIKYLKNKHGGIDVEQKFSSFKIKAKDLLDKLLQLYEDYEILKELFEEFDGYTSDTQEDDFIDKLGIEIKEIAAKHQQAVEHNEKLTDKITHAQKNLSRQGPEQVNSQEIEKRAQLVSEIEEEAQVNERLVDDIDYRVNRNKKVFMNMKAREKLERREQECLELSKRLVQFGSQVNEVEQQIQEVINILKQNQTPDINALNDLEKINQQLISVKNDYQQPGLALKQIYAHLGYLKESQNYHQFDLLKENIQIKKRILENLNLIKQIRHKFNLLKVDLENIKPKKQIAYKPIKGDYVDQLLADWINNNSCPVPISRIGNGFYMFGTKKIFAKIMNGKLLIRVGGGYMGIDEFMFYYGAQELNKLLAYEDFEGDEEIDLDKIIDIDNNKDIIQQFSDGKQVIGAQQFKKRLSPRALASSPRGSSPRSRAGQHSMQESSFLKQGVSRMSDHQK